MQKRGVKKIIEGNLSTGDFQLSLGVCGSSEHISKFKLWGFGFLESKRNSKLFSNQKPAPAVPSWNKLCTFSFCYLDGLCPTLMVCLLVWVTSPQCSTQCKKHCCDSFKKLQQWVPWSFEISKTLNVLTQLYFSFIYRKKQCCNECTHSFTHSFLKSVNKMSFKWNKVFQHWQSIMEFPKCLTCLNFPVVLLVSVILRLTIG